MPRIARVVTTCQAFRFGSTVEENRERTMDLLDMACAQRPDLVCLPEGFVTAGLRAPIAETAETVPGPTTDACAKRAREHRTYVVCPVTTSRDGALFNSAVFIDRQGQVAGVYDKIHPVSSTHDHTEVEDGMTPGATAPTVFDLDFGRVGCQICFDIGFPESWADLARAGAELVLWPSAYDGGLPLTLYAYMHSYWVVSSVRSRMSRMVDPLGRIQAMTGEGMRVAARAIDLDYIVCHSDFHAGFPERLKRELGEAVDVSVLQAEGRFMVSSNSDETPLATLEERYGLSSAADYHARHLSAYEALRAGRTPEPQVTPYAGRPPYG